MRLTKDNWIVLGVLAVVTVAYFLVVYRAQSSSLAEVRASTAQTKRDLEQSVSKAAQVPPMLRQIEAMKQRYNKDWDRRLPQRQELAGFLREISQHLSEEQLSNGTIKPGDPTRGPLYHRLPISMTFEGTFLSLARFVKRVDEMTRLTRIDRFEIEPGQGDGGLSMEVGMNIYFTEE